MVDNQGYLIPAGTQVGIIDPDGNIIPFETTDDVSVYPGSTATAVGAVTIQASDPGADGNAIGTAGSQINLIDPLAFVDTVTLEAVTSGGQDAESDDAYLNRLSAQLQLLAPRPIVPEDFAIFARNIPGVYRATAIDLYNPGPPIVTNADRTVSVAITDENGQPCSASVKAAVDADLQARREVNFNVFVIDPTYTTIAVTTTVQGLSGWDAPTTQSAIVTALQAYFNPANWGQSDSDPQAWINTPTVRYLEVSQVINSVPGVDYIVSLTIGAPTMGTADLTMAGVAPLPEPGTMTVTVTPGP
jgi:uncharacterized phage protein gp47/JayE